MRSEIIRKGQQLLAIAAALQSEGRSKVEEMLADVMTSRAEMYYLDKVTGQHWYLLIEAASNHSCEHFHLASNKFCLNMNVEQAKLNII